MEMRPAFSGHSSKHCEQTVAAPLAFSGIGLHSGAPVQLRLLPAPAGSGVVFRRTDLDNFDIPATGRNVAKVSYATSLMRQGVLSSTTEHLLSALTGLSIDNCIVELDNLELPILDGSALPYVQAIREAGVKPQRRRRQYLRVLRPIEVRDGNKFLGIYPADSYSIDYLIDFPTPIGRQQLSLDLLSGAYASLIAPARTFGFREDEQKLRGMGLIRGVSPQSAIIVAGGCVANGPLRFTDEFVRHKILDLIGALALAGRQILGRVVAERAGHAMHTALVSRLLRDRSAAVLTAEPASVPRAAAAPSLLASVPA